MKQATGGMIDFQSTITCPHCGHQETEIMPLDACRFFYDCVGCGAVLRPNQGDCCIYCSHGSVAWPPKQRDGRPAPRPDSAAELRSGKVGPRRARRGKRVAEFRIIEALSP
jgi:hypothetical protein